MIFKSLGNLLSRRAQESKKITNVSLIVIFVLSLAVFLHWKEERVDHLHLNRAADKYIIAQVGFEFQDREATHLLKEEAVRELGKIYALDDRDADANLLKLRFASAKTIHKLKEIGMATDSFVVYEGGQLSYPGTLIEDFEMHNQTRRAIIQTIPMKMTKVNQGARIINAGDKVVMRHINMLEAMKKELSKQRSFVSWETVGNFGIATILTLLILVYFKALYPSVLRSFSQMALIATISLLTFGMAKVVDCAVINKLCALLDFCHYPIFSLFPALTLAIMIDRKIAVTISSIIALFLVMVLDLEYSHFILGNIMVAIATMIFVKRVRRRKDIFTVCTKVWLTLIPLIIAVNFREEPSWNLHFVADIFTSFLCIAVTSILVVILLPILESVFKIVTDITLLDSADLSHPLLRRLNLEAPGTYRHSVAVAALAEEAAVAIHANPVFCRVAALYHDIGKVAQPQYFTENQFSGFNMHQLLTPLESAQVIIAHVTEGVKLAHQYELPWNIIDVIREHHGTGLVYYFYHAQIEQCRMKSAAVEEGRFRYPGPTPRSRESAIIMIADSVEAAFRCLDDVTEKSVVDLVESIVSHKIREHQFDRSRLTFDELESVKKALIKALVSGAHKRVKFPEKSSVGWKSEEVFAKLT